MLTTEPTPEMIARWKRIFEAGRDALKPNRKTGGEVDRYFREKYPCQEFYDQEFRQVCGLNITENEFSRRKLPEGALPDIRCYRAGDVLVGIDLASGEIHVECENIGKGAAVYDDLFAFRGLDENDLKNFFLTAEYITLTQGDAAPGGA